MANFMLEFILSTFPQLSHGIERHSASRQFSPVIRWPSLPLVHRRIVWLRLSMKPGKYSQGETQNFPIGPQQYRWKGFPGYFRGVLTTITESAKKALCHLTMVVATTSNLPW